MIELRPYQHDIVTDVRQEMRRHKSVLAQLSTGGGKTALASYMVASAMEKGNSVFFCVHRRDLIRQTTLTFQEFNIKHSYIAAGYLMNPHSKAHICSIDTLRNRMEIAPVPKLVFIDECHMANSASWSNIIEFYRKKGAWIIGLTATPHRTDGSGMGKHFETMIQGPSMAWLIENKFLSDYRLYAPSSPNLEGIGTRAGDYAKDQLAARMDNDPVIIGDAIKHYKKHAMDKLCIAYCVSRKHSANVVDKFNAEGIAAHHIDGETPMDERIRIIRAFANREIKVLSNVALISTGFDLASQVGRDINVEGIIDLAPTKSLSLFLQKLGRGLRYKPEPAVFLDHAGNVARHGLPDEERQWTLEETKKRRDSGDVEKTVPTKSCMTDANGPGCYYTHRPAPQCPACGHIYEVQYRTVDEVDGELAEITRAPRTLQEQESMQKALDKLVHNGIKKGMPRFVAMKWAAKEISKQMARKR